MKRKAIKYLICIILIVTTLILIPIKNVKAETEETVTVTYSKYKESNKIFCIDKGYALRGTLTYKISEFPSTIAVKAQGNGNSYGVLTKDFFEYIVAESVTNTTRKDPNTHVPQIAIWNSLGSNMNGIDSKLIEEANDLRDIASSYVSYYFGAGKDEPCIKEDDNYAYIYFNVSDSGDYTPLIKTSIVPEWLEGGQEEKGDYVIDDKSYNSRIKYKKKSGGIPEIRFKYELERNANLQLWETDNKTMNSYLIYNDIDGDRVLYDLDNCYFIKVWEEDSYNYFCFKCNNEYYEPKDYSAAIRLGMNPLIKNGDYYECTRHKIKLEDKNDTSKLYANDNIRNYKVYFTETSKVLNATDDWQLINTYYQRLIHGDGEIRYQPMRETFKPLITPVEIPLQKQNFNGGTVSGATINITKGTGVASVSPASIQIKNNRTR